MTVFEGNKIITNQVEYFHTLDPAVSCLEIFRDFLTLEYKETYTDMFSVALCGRLKKIIELKCSSIGKYLS